MADTLSPDQLNAMIRMSKITPTQSAGALSSSTNGLFNTLSGAYKSYTDVLGGISKGVGQAEVGMATGLGTLVSQAGSHLPGQVGQAFAGGAQLGKEVLASPQLQPQTIPEKIGKFGTDVASFFVPGGAEKEALAKGVPYIEKLPQLLGLGGKAATALTGTLKTALQGIISGVSMGGVTAAQTGDMEKAKGAASLGTAAGTISGALEVFGPGIVEALNKADFKLSPAAEAKTAKIADNASRFITQNKITGTSATKYAKLNQLNSQFEATLQKSLPEDIAVPKQAIIDNINSKLETIRSSDPAVYNQAKTKADEAINLLQTQKGDNAFTKGGTIGVKDALAGKRSWASMAFKTSKASKRDPLVSSEGAYAVEQGYQKALEETLQKTNTPITIPQQLARYFGGNTEITLSEFNKVYSDAINAKNLSYMAQYKNDTGLFGRLFGLWAGESIGQAISPGLGGKVVGGAVGEVLSTHLPGMVRNVGERTLSHPDVPETAAKLYQSTQNNP